ncbi:pro-MCH [Neosynchiropus ocellatus]
MLSTHSVLFTLVMFSELSSHLVAMPMDKVEDSIAENNGLGSLLGDDPGDETVESRNLALERNGEKRPRIIVISDMRLNGHSVPVLTAASTRGLPLVTERRVSRLPADNHLKIERRDTDLDVLRCMIGRVYRPCWEV